MRSWEPELKEGEGEDGIQSGKEQKELQAQAARKE